MNFIFDSSIFIRLYHPEAPEEITEFISDSIDFLVLNAWTLYLPTIVYSEVVA